MPSLTFTNNHTGSSSSADNFLPALHHAISGSAGTLISTCALYPLSLVITRLQAQRQLQREGRASSSNHGSGNTTTTGPNGRGAATGPAQEPTYAGITEAFSRIWSSGGGPKAFYTGLGQDAAKSVLDSFLFFLFYEWFRSARLQASSNRRSRRAAAAEIPGLGILEELAVGMAAGACSRFFTTPIANVVTRKQTAAFVDACGRDEVSVREIVDSIRKEGLSGFWSGYSASLVLTLNPSITFFLQEFLKKKTVSSEKWDNPGPAMTFLLAAISKAIASAVTYPFQTAKTRLQTGIPVAPKSTREVQASKEADQASVEAQAPEGVEAQGEEAAKAEGEAPAPDDVPLSPKSKGPPRKAVTIHNVAPPERNTGADAKFEAQAMRAVKNFGKQSIFGTVAQIARTEGIRSLYDGLPAELLKGFLSHGTTMLAKGVVHRMLFRLYFIIAGALAEVRARRARANTDVSTVAARAQEVMNRSALAPAPAPASTPAATPNPTPAPTPALSEVSTTTTVEETIETRALPALPAPESAPAPTSEQASEPTPPTPTTVPEQPAELPPLPSLPSPRSPQSLRSRSSSLLQGGAGRPLLPAPSPPSLAPPLLTLSTLPSSSSSSSRLQTPPPQQPSQQLRALRYRLDNVDEWGPKARRPSFPIADNGSGSAGAGAGASGSVDRPRRSSALDDFVVNVVANMIDGTQRGLKGER
ncbi:mitochondrial carrier domain-containing protein [Hypoxylon sp. NC0597]|nr:mitochondrial carrier domain-containing protein [Hypoxylon sp. NC0597]